MFFSVEPNLQVKNLTPAATYTPLLCCIKGIIYILFGVSLLLSASSFVTINQSFKKTFMSNFLAYLKYLLFK